MKLRGIELRRISMPLVSPFRTSFGTQTERDVLLVKAVTDDAEGLGRVRRADRPALFGRIRRLAAGRAAPLPAAETRLAGGHGRGRTVGGGGRRGPAASVQGTPHGQSRGGDGAPRRGTARARPVVRPRTRRRRRPRAQRCLGGHPRLDPRAAGRRPGLSGRGIRPHQTQDRTGLGPGPGGRRARTLRGRRAPPGRRQHRLHPPRRPPPGQARRLRPAADRAAAGGGGRPGPRRAGPAAGHPDLPRRVGRVRADRRRGDHASARARSSTSSRAGSAATWRRRKIHDLAAAPRGRRSGAAAWWRPASAAPPTSPWPPCPASPCPATCRPPTASTATDITEPFVLADGHLAVPTGPGLGVTPIPELLESVTTSKRSGSPSDVLAYALRA